MNTMNQQELMKVNHFLAFLEHNNPSEIARILADKGSEFQINEFRGKIQTLQSQINTAEIILKVREANENFEKIVEKNNELIKQLNRNGHKTGVLFGNYLKVV